MCGIVGLWAAGGDPGIERYARQMCQALRHRGPDGEGVWVDSSGQVALGHRRLAIVDLTPTGHQPMVSQCGRFTITYNGELYNTAELRRELELAGHKFRGTSDTEVLVNGISEWGVSKTCLKLSGIFAFAVWDASQRQLSLARDRAGVKPLFFSSTRRRLSFSSEVRAIALLPDFDRSMDRNAVQSLITNDHIQNPNTIYRCVKAVPPGSIVSFQSPDEPSLSRYWDVADVVASGARGRQAHHSVEETLNVLERLLEDAVRRQLVSDVPIGAFLSGGIDSSLITALMQKNTSDQIKTFSIGFQDPALDEAPYAKAVAAHLGTDHRELYVDDRTVTNTIPLISDVLDQPLSDVSSIPMYLLSKMAAEEVKVSLSGDGGDELFFGYTRYLEAMKVRRALARAPAPLLRTFAAALSLFGGGHVREVGFLNPGRSARLAWHAARLVHYGSQDLNDVYLHFVTSQLGPRLMESKLPHGNKLWTSNKSVTTDFPELLMLHDFTGYLPDEVLTKLDRTTMASSLEGRVPFLDERVVEFSWGMPMSLKLRDGVGKWCVRSILSRHVPQSIVDRPKAGFGPPIGKWLRGPLKDWAESLLTESAIKNTGLLNLNTTRAVWDAHSKGRVDASSNLGRLRTMPPETPTPTEERDAGIAKQPFRKHEPSRE
jgi:asparagine synthase (glutamine-hydrolysing)